MDAKCQRCNKPLGGKAVQGLCPECLLRAGLETNFGSQPPNPVPPPEPAELAKYFPQLEILELLGRGGMGAVYKARQKELDRIVAVKILSPGISHDASFADRFSREAKALAKLNHPNIVTIHDFGQVSGTGVSPVAGSVQTGETPGQQGQTGETPVPLFYFVMEFVDGVSLRQLIEAGRIEPREALAIIPQICDALQYAHDHGIVHRDIKPDNILLDRQGRVKVADFGLAKIVAAAGVAALVPSAESSGRTALHRSTATTTDHGHILGTPPYMAPEQKEQPLAVDHRADIYSLGVVLYQMLTGKLPTEPLELPSKKIEVDVRLDEIVLRALEKNPEKRYQQVSELKTMVETVRGTGVPPVSPGSERKKTGGTPVLLWALAGLLVVFLALGFAMNWWRHSPTATNKPTSSPARDKFDQLLAETGVTNPLTRTPRRGGSGGGKFVEVLDGRSLLVGFNLRTGDYAGHHVLTGVQPIWRTPTGLKLGGIHSQNKTLPIHIEAREGYAVGAIRVNSGFRVDGLEVIFMRVNESGTGLLTNDTYKSEWVGGHGGGESSIADGNGRPVVGIYGSDGLELDSLGLLQVGER